MVSRKFRKGWKVSTKSLFESCVEEVNVVDLSSCIGSDCIDFPCGDSKYAIAMRKYKRLIKSNSRLSPDAVWAYLEGDNLQGDNEEPKEGNNYSKVPGNCFRKLNPVDDGF
ncbi:hypothetical protein GOV13_04015 [Candidatus Pacearchaeota archaeon]|nr:hypothetical protein [Candidatus Pacearchaeota archaeon]